MTSPAAAFDVPLPLDGPGEVLITLRLPESWTDDSLRTTGLRRTTASDLRWQRMQSVADMIRGFASAESNAGASGNNLRMLVGRLARWAEAARTAGGTAAERASRLCGEVAEALEPNNPREAAILRGTRTAVDPLAVVDPSESLMSQLPGVTHNFRSLGKWTIRRATSQSPGVPTPAPLWLMALISVATLLALFLTPRTRGRARSAISAALAVGCVALVPELWMLGVISLLCLALRESGPQAAAA
jgi:hypothetical protein